MNPIPVSVPASISVREARDAYLEENGFDLAGYTAPTFEIEVFGRAYTFTNPPARQWAIPLHDLHHVATGYGTDLIGEAEIGAFELVGGCKTGIVYVLDIIAVATGFAVAPIRTWRAFRHARQSHSRALFRTDPLPEPLLDLSVGELRARLGLPASGLAERRQLHDAQSAARQPWWMLALGAMNGWSTAATAGYELVRGRSLEGVPLVGSAVVTAVVVALAGLFLALAAPAMRRGLLFGRAVFGHAAAVLIAANLASVAFFHMNPALAILAAGVPLLLLAKLARS